MEPPQEPLTHVDQLQEDGRTKDAYLKLLDIINTSCQQLQDAKFVHQTMVNAPKSSEQLLSRMQSSLDKLQYILQPKPSNTRPPLPPRRSNLSVKRPVPLPIVTQTSPPPAKPEDTHLPPPLPRRQPIPSPPVLDDEDDEDEDLDLLPSATPTTEYPAHGKTDEPSTQESMPHGIHDHENYGRLCIESDSLVPAQMDPSETLAMSSTSEIHVPKIPAPPLLECHRQLQQELDKTPPVPRPSSTPPMCTTNSKPGPSRSGLLATMSPLDPPNNTALVQMQLTEVRAIYMSAMTVNTILDLSPQLIAYQLTWIESAIFYAIPPEALRLHRANAKKSPDPHIAASTDFFNYLTRSIEHSILLPQEASHRAQVIVHWISVATHCLSLHNYQTLKAIISALGTPPIQRLKRTWEYIPKKRMSRLDAMTALMSEAENYHRYREHLRLFSLARPICPFLGVILYDMTYALTSDQPDHIQQVLDTMTRFLACPRYPSRPSSKFCLKKKGMLGQLRGAATLSFSSNPPASVGDDSLSQQDMAYAITIEQQRIMHYLLTRPWVSEKVIDELSSLRESSSAALHHCSSIPNHRYYHSRSRANSYQHSLATSASSTTSSSISANPLSRSASWRSSGQSRTHSLNFSTHSWLSLSTSTSTNNEDIPASPRSFLDDPSDPPASPRRSIGSFWPFRKSAELSRDDLSPSLRLSFSNDLPTHRVHHQKSSSLDNPSVT
ncbi:ras GEF [Hesseltinella vesiculosa]|uniref:Ras GEF n=1 Tax=Hesseltinella vesiculosa TaxID=101127 RepID=A0A1X2G4Q3_9FUNG|nr:ras GEF [Hesseltinella vesiculosa]